jgi:Kip1 ubiquitination-promoting complex protein 2
MCDVLQFQSEVRKILISLVGASARILTACPDSDEVSQVIQERLDTRAKSEPDLQAVSLFKDMGFSEHVASRALHLNR